MRDGIKVAKTFRGENPANTLLEAIKYRNQIKNEIRNGNLIKNNEH